MSSSHKIISALLASLILFLSIAFIAGGSHSKIRIHVPVKTHTHFHTKTLIKTVHIPVKVKPKTHHHHHHFLEDDDEVTWAKSYPKKKKLRPVRYY